MIHGYLLLPFQNLLCLSLLPQVSGVLIAHLQYKQTNQHCILSWLGINLCLCLAQLLILAQFLGNLFSGCIRHTALSGLAGAEQQFKLERGFLVPGRRERPRCGAGQSLAAVGLCCKSASFELKGSPVQNLKFRDVKRILTSGKVWDVDMWVCTVISLFGCSPQLFGCFHDWSSLSRLSNPQVPGLYFFNILLSLLDFWCYIWCACIYL